MPEALADSSISRKRLKHPRTSALAVTSCRMQYRWSAACSALVSISGSPACAAAGQALGVRWPRPWIGNRRIEFGPATRLPRLGFWRRRSLHTGPLIATFRCTAAASCSALAEEGRCGYGGAGQDTGGDRRVVGSVTRFAYALQSVGPLTAGRARRSIRFARLERELHNAVMRRFPIFTYADDTLPFRTSLQRMRMSIPLQQLPTLRGGIHDQV